MLLDHLFAACRNEVRECLRDCCDEGFADKPRSALQLKTQKHLSDSDLPGSFSVALSTEAPPLVIQGFWVLVKNLIEVTIIGIYCK